MTATALALLAEDGGRAAYPDASDLPRSGVQRGSAFNGFGDPVTPGWPAAPPGA